MESHQTPRRRRVLTVIAASVGAVVLAAGGGVAWALDRFVIDHVEVESASAHEAEVAASTEDESTAVSGVTDDATEDPDIEITTYCYGSGDDSALVYVADVTFSDITQLRTAFADDAFGTNITEIPSEIADTVSAAFAVNGDYYGFRDTGIQIRNGVIYRDEGARIGAVIYGDGTMEVYDETTSTAAELQEAGAWQTLSFGPALVDDGEIVDGIDEVEIDTNFGNHSIQGDQPRTAIGMIDANHYVFVVVDGRSSESAGVTLTELAEIMTDLGATEAYNLDGGGSSTMLYDGELVNNPLGKGEERATSDILYFG